MNTKTTILLAICALALGACSKQSADKNAEAAASASAAVAMTDDALDEAPIPVKEDFEEQARQTITADNVDEQLDQLEKQIKEDR